MRTQSMKLAVAMTLGLLIPLGGSGCMELNHAEGHYACSPGLANTCPDGWVCRYSAEAGEDRCFSTDGDDVCGDGVCSESEDACSCPQDGCAAVCGDGCCTAGSETTDSCAQDCEEVICGDGVCSEGETLPCMDCAVCGDGLCTLGAEDLASCAEDCESCGDETCDTAGGETAQSCEADCPPECGDGACTHNENICGCGTDGCAARCGDGCCTTASETAASCALDCPDDPTDGLCTGSETACTAPADCPASCGDGCCTTGGGEGASTCEADCPAVCGDTFCTHSETADTTSCPEDCHLCGDGQCTVNYEEYANCPADCPPPAECPNGTCGANETAGSCPADCPEFCGDGFVTHTEVCDSNTRTCNVVGCTTNGVETCTSPACTWGSCVFPSETCNGADDNCDLTCDEGCHQAVYRLESTIDADQFFTKDLTVAISVAATPYWQWANGFPTEQAYFYTLIAPLAGTTQLYMCRTNDSQVWFVSPNSSCDGYVVNEPLGYVTLTDNTLCEDVRLHYLTLNSQNANAIMINETDRDTLIVDGWFYNTSATWHAWSYP